ncbi:glycoside hydrolase family 5 protein [Asticcacaulis solisilvae]|uniref:glycoside hydrolase family 5 protein n=1 Tax=Asticcacaulis solisilvae TaxID=1217274 RepID=UPI003FD88C01
MFKPLLLATAALLFATPFAAQAKSDFAPISAEAQVAAMQRGVNIIGYDPYWRDGGQGNYKDQHFKAIHDAGFSTVRVVLFTFSHLQADGTLDPKWLAKLDWVVDEALKYKLNVIIDEHDFEDCSKDKDACLARLKTVWAQLSARYADRPNAVMFELLNEPHDALNGAPWNAMIPELLAIVRKDNPERNVVVGPTHWNSPHDLKDLVLPDADRHLIVTVHYYDPFRFTHQGASWAPPAITAGHDIPFGAPEEIAQISKDFDAVADWGKANHRPILLGEFGAYDKAPMDSRVVWTNAVARAAEAHGFAWAYWQFSSDFILYDFKTQSFVKPILNALVPESKE